MRCPPWPQWRAQSNVWRGRPDVGGLWGAEEHACRRPGPRAETYESRLGYRAESGPVPRRAGQPPLQCSPRGGVPGHAPHWSTGIRQPGRGERGNLLPRGRVSERQTGHRSTNSGRRTSTCRRGLRSLAPWLPRASACGARGGSGRELGGGLRSDLPEGPAGAGVRRRTRPFP